MDKPHSPNPLVLICDDEPQIVSVLGRQAKRLGLKFIGDTDAHHVCDLAREHQPAVIILDIMQNIDGRDILAALKKDPATRNLKVIMLSAISAATLPEGTSEERGRDRTKPESSPRGVGSGGTGAEEPVHAVLLRPVGDRPFPAARTAVHQ